MSSRPMWNNPQNSLREPEKSGSCFYPRCSVIGTISDQKQIFSFEIQLFRNFCLHFKMPGAIIQIQSFFLRVIQVITLCFSRPSFLLVCFIYFMFPRRFPTYRGESRFFIDQNNYQLYDQEKNKYPPMWAQYRKFIGRRSITPCRFYIYDDMRSAVIVSQLIPQHRAA